MIFCFSGTGNSRHAAVTISAATGDAVVSLNDRIRNADTSAVSEGRIIIVTPTYGWRIPRIVAKWIRETQFPAGSEVWFVMTCGGSIGAAPAYNRTLALQKGLRYMGTAGVVMPENYLAMFDVPDDSEASEIIASADPEIQAAAEKIAAGKALPETRTTVIGRFESGPVNAAFYRFSVKADGFRVKEDCISCGRCETLCPLNNISLTDGRPVWGSSCTHCMACIAHCPVEAIEYGRKSVGKPRYHVD